MRYHKRVMKITGQSGSAAAAVLVMALAVMLVTSLSFAVWAFVGRQEYKNEADKKIAAAIRTAEANQKLQLEKAFAQQQKSPYRTFSGSPTYGSVSFSFPRTWNVYVDEGQNSSQPLKALLHPEYVPAQKQDTAYALKVEMLAQPYEQVITQYQSQIGQGKVSAAGFVPPKMAAQPNLTPGVRYDGQVNNNRRASLIVIKVRDKTLIVTTDGVDFLNDFNQVVLPSLSFVP